MALVSSAILNDALENVARMLCNDTQTSDDYAGMGAAEDSTAAAAAQHDLIGSETHYNAVTGAYEASYKATWTSTFLYADITNHIIEELVICESAAAHLNQCLLRIVLDAVTLNVGEQVTMIIKCACQQGS